MNSKIACAALLAAMGIGKSAHSADLYRLNPANSSFTATGQGTVMGPEGSYQCTVTLTGTTGKTVGSINGVALSGPPGCENVMATGLPWRMGGISKSKIQITHFTLVYPGLGKCGPNQVNGTLMQGTLSIQDHVPSKQGVCKIDASLTMSPPLSITTK